MLKNLLKGIAEKFIGRPQPNSYQNVFGEGPEEKLAEKHCTGTKKWPTAGVTGKDKPPWGACASAKKGRQEKEPKGNEDSNVSLQKNNLEHIASGSK